MLAPRSCSSVTPAVAEFTAAPLTGVITARTVLRPRATPAVFQLQVYGAWLSEQMFCQLTGPGGSYWNCTELTPGMAQASADTVTSELCG